MSIELDNTLIMFLRFIILSIVIFNNLSIQAQSYSWLKSEDKTIIHLGRFLSSTSSSTKTIYVSDNKKWLLENTYHQQPNFSNYYLINQNFNAASFLRVPVTKKTSDVFSNPLLLNNKITWFNLYQPIKGKEPFYIRYKYEGEDNIKTLSTIEQRIPPKLGVYFPKIITNQNADLVCIPYRLFKEDGFIHRIKVYNNYLQEVLDEIVNFTLEGVTKKSRYEKISFELTDKGILCISGTFVNYEVSADAHDYECPFIILYDVVNKKIITKKILEGTIYNEKNKSLQTARTFIKNINEANDRIQINNTFETENSAGVHIREIYISTGKEANHKIVIPKEEYRSLISKKTAILELRSFLKNSGNSTLLVQLNNNLDFISDGSVNCHDIIVLNLNDKNTLISSKLIHKHQNMGTAPKASSYFSHLENEVLYIWFTTQNKSEGNILKQIKILADGDLEESILDPSPKNKFLAGFETTPIILEHNKKKTIYLLYSEGLLNQNYDFMRLKF